MGIPPHIYRAQKLKIVRHFYQSISGRASDPGHAGVTSFLEYYFKIDWYKEYGGATGSLLYKLQYREIGGSWTDIFSNTVDITAGSSRLSSTVGVFTTPITLPIEVRIIGTDSNATWRIENIGGAYYSAYLRAVGSV